MCIFAVRNNTFHAVPCLFNNHINNRPWGRISCMGELGKPERDKRRIARLFYFITIVWRIHHSQWPGLSNRERDNTNWSHCHFKIWCFCHRNKNYRGEIYGDDNRQEWTQIIATDVTFTRKWWKTYTYVTKNQFYNPVKQSQGHSFKIKELLQNLYPYLKIIPIVVFVGDAVLKNVTSKSHVIYEKDLLSTINNYKVIYLNDKDVQVVHDILTGNNVRELVNNRQHVKNLQATEKEVKDTIESGICPKCGGQLIKHNGKYGTFYGCSNYPKCKFSTK